MSWWSGFLDKHVERQRGRNDPLARLPWAARLAIAVVVVLLGVLQLASGNPTSVLLGLALLIGVAPMQVVTALAARRVQQELR